MKTIARTFAASIHQLITGQRAGLATLRARLRAASIPTNLSDWCPANCGNIMTLLAHLCDMDDQMRTWVLRWLAYQVRNPSAKMSTALILNGGQASGKTLFLNYVVADLFGQSASIIRPHQLHSTFNGWAAHSGLVLVEGEFSPAHIARLKDYITAREIVIERKGTPSCTMQNRMNFIYVTSDPDFLPMDIPGRRFAVLEVPPPRPREFYHAVLEEIANGGLEAFRHYLMHGVDLGSFNESTQPPLPALQKEAA